MTGAELQAVQTRHGWSNQALADVLNEALGRNYRRGAVTAWRNGRTPVPKGVEAFLTGLGDGSAPAAAPPPEPPPVDDERPPDLPPAGAGLGEETELPQLPPPRSGVYTKICEEFFEVIATGVGMIGAGIGSEALRRDGQIILADKASLGAAWGKLAEQNETFARILVATDKQGAYLAVALATGTTVGKIWQNHQPARLRLDEEPPPAPPGPGQSGNGDQPPPV